MNRFSKLKIWVWQLLLLCRLDVYAAVSHAQPIPDLALKGKSAGVPCTVQATVFASMEEHSMAIKGNTTQSILVVSAASTEASAKTLLKASSPELKKRPQDKLELAYQQAGTTNVPSATPSPYLRTQSIGTKVEKAADAGDEFSLPALNGSNLIDKEFIFLPLSTELQKKSYKFDVFGVDISEKKVFPYDAHLGKTLVVKSFQPLLEWHRAKYGADKMDKFFASIYTKQKTMVYAVEVKETGESFAVVYDKNIPVLNYLAPKRDLDFAQDKLLNKKFWLNTRKVYRFDAEKEQVITVEIPKWKEVEVTDVALGTDANPVRLIFKDTLNEVFYLDVSISPKTSLGVGYDFFGRDAVILPLYKVILKNNPLGQYAWSKEIVKDVTEERVVIGMNPEQVRAAWGKPKSVSKSTLSNDLVEIWFYEDSSVTFHNNVCKSVVSGETR